MNGNNEENEKKKKRRLLIILLLLLLLVIITGTVLAIKLTGFTDVTADKGDKKDIDTIVITEPGEASSEITDEPVSPTESILPTEEPSSSEEPEETAKKKPHKSAQPTQQGGGGGATVSPTVTPSPSVSPTPSVTPSPSVSPTPSVTPSPSATNSFGVVDKKTGKYWTQLSTIDIFKDGQSIAPGSTGSYEFRIENGINGDAFFTMSFEEASHTAGAIPFEYRLKCGSGYVTGEEWLTAENMGKINVALNKSGSIDYTLEWRWPYEKGTTSAEKKANNASDTALGVSSNRTHKLTVTINAAAVN